MQKMSLDVKETRNELDVSGVHGIDCSDFVDMKIRNLAWMGAGLLLAGVAGAAVVCRRKGERELPAEPGETEEHAALRKIMEESAAYNDSLYERMCELENTDEPSARPAAVADLTFSNQEARRNIDALRSQLQEQLAAQGRTFMDVDGFADLISQYRGITLKQQKRHMELFQRIKTMKNVPASPELHAFLKIGFKDAGQLQVDTEQQLMKVAASQRDIMLRAGRVLSMVDSESSASAACRELQDLAARYLEYTDTIRLYREDDPEGAENGVAELRSLYSALLPMLNEQATRLRNLAFFNSEGLRDIVNRMLPAAS